MNSERKRQRKIPTVVAVAVLAIAGIVVVATVVQAIRQDSVGPIWMIGWLPAVLVASLYRPAAGKPRRPRGRARTQT